MNEVTKSRCADPSCNGDPETTASTRWIDIGVAVLHRTAPEAPTGAREVLVARRLDGAVRGGLWEFPGGKIEVGEAALDAALRELEEETGIAIGDARTRARALPVASDFDPCAARERAVRLFGFLIEAPCSAVAEARASAEVRWVPLEELGELPWPPANRLLLESIAGALRALRTQAI